MTRDGAGLNLRHVDASPWDAEARAPEEDLLSATFVVRNAKALFLEYKGRGVASSTSRIGSSRGGRTTSSSRIRMGTSIHFASRRGGVRRGGVPEPGAGEPDGRSGAGAGRLVRARVRVGCLRFGALGGFRADAGLSLRALTRSTIANIMTSVSGRRLKRRCDRGRDRSTSTRASTAGSARGGRPRGPNPKLWHRAARSSPRPIPAT